MKPFFSIFFLLLSSSLAISQDVVFIDTTSSTSEFPIENNIASSSRVDSLLEAAFRFQGVPYKYGGMGLDGMDCSGLICRVYSELDISVPHSSTSLSQIGEYIGADDLEPGDLIFFKGRSANSVGHVAMVSKVQDGLIYIIHASTSRGVIEEVLQDNEYFMKRWLHNRRLH